MKQCLQIDQVGNSRNDITQNNLKNFSATYLLKIGTCGQQRLEITAFFVVYARYRAPNTDLQIFYQFLLVHLVKKCECRKCKLLLSQSEHQRLKKMLCIAKIAEKHLKMLKMLIQGRVLPRSRPILIFLASDSESSRKKT